MTAPGKMFRPDFTGIPMPFDRDVELSIREERRGRGDSIASGMDNAGTVIDAVDATLSVIGNL